MSRSNPNLLNPAKHFFRWKGDDGRLTYWDKETEKEVVVKLPFEFLPIDQLNTIKGFCEQDNSSYWSNEVRSLKEEFTVKTSAGTKEVGLYKDLECRAKGAKYTKSIYCVYVDKTTGEYVMGNIQASGVAVTAWIEFSRKYVVENGKVVLSGSTEGKKGKVTYQIPTFEYVHSTEAEDKIAVELDKELQIYLSQYLSGKDEEPLPSVPDDPDDIVTDIPDEQSEVDTQVGENIEERLTQKAGVEGEPVPDSEIPF
jgi:hypothetical protein